MRGGRYSERRVRALIETYPSLKEKVDTTRRGLEHLVEVADLDRALALLPLKYFGPVFLVGLVGLPQDAAGRLLGVSQQAVSKRFQRGVEEATYYMNGGD